MDKPATPKPPKEALEYMRAKGYKLSWDYYEVWREEHNVAFTVAKVANKDLLIDIRTAIDDALANGKSFEHFKENIEPILAKKGWVGHKTMPNGSTVELGTPRRLKIIYDTNMRTARAAGRWQRIQKTRQTQPYLMYEIGPSQHHRQQHVAWQGIILPIDDPFWDTHFTPNGWGCKCFTRSITRSRAEARGGVSESPEIKKVTWRNKKTGKIEHVPEGIDPGWDYNPGKTRSSRIQQLGKDKDAEFKKVVGTAGAAVEVEQRILPSALSTLKNISADNIEEILKLLPGAGDRLKRVQAFTKAKGTKTVIIRQSEMGARNKSSVVVREQILDYLDDSQRQYGHYNYTTSKPAKVGGFTSASFNHVVIKGDNKVNFRKADRKKVAEELRRAVDKAVSTKNTEVWALAYGGSKEAEIVATWVHELGHQVHYWAGAPDAPVGVKYLTKYSRHRVSVGEYYEYHAENFSAWLFNREAFAEFDPIGAKHFDDLIEKAIQGKKRTR